MPFAALMDPAWYPWVGGGLAFVGALVLTPLVIRWARRMDWLAYPQADRWHEEPTALMGGIAIYAAATLAILPFLGSEGLLPLFGGATVMFLTGLVDDLKGVKPVTKLIAQVVATVLLLYAGYAFGKGGPFWLSVPLTFLWVIGITNSVNLLDNMDGLAAGIAVIAALVLAAFSVFEGNAVGTEAILAIAGAAGGFLVYNFKPARIFMGDSGSLFLGYAIAAFSMLIQGHTSGGSDLAIYLVSGAVLAVPIFDTTLVTIVRTLSGRSVSQGGQDHSSHRLVVLGLSERRAVLTLYSVSLAFGALALAFHFAEVKLFYALATFFVVGLAVFGIHLGSVNVYRTEEESHRNGRPYDGNGAASQERTLKQRVVAVMRAFMGRNWKAALCVVADVLLVTAAFILAHYLRFENGLSPRREASLMQSLPGVVGIKLLVFFAAGLHRGMWQHAGTLELIRIVKASLLASALAYGAMAVVYGTPFLSEAVFFIDWLIVTLAVAGVRFGFRGLRQYLSAKRNRGRRVLLYGAGSAGLLTLRELRQNAGRNLCPVGFVDDDPSKQGMTVQGMVVLGTFEDVPRLCEKHQVEEVLITFRLSENRRTDIMQTCREIGLSCRAFDLSLTALPVERNPMLADM